MIAVSRRRSIALPLASGLMEQVDYQDTIAESG